MKISINLLPHEITKQRIKASQFYKVQLLGIIIILVMLFLASLTVALRVLQSHNLSLYQAQIAQAQQKVSDLKSTQASLVLLKDRLNVIDRYFGVSSKQSAMYKLLDKLIPSAIVVNSITIDQTGGASFAAIVPDSISLDNLINKLTSKTENEGYISQVSVESLTRGREGFYRVSLKLKPGV